MVIYARHLGFFERRFGTFLDGECYGRTEPISEMMMERWKIKGYHQLYQTTADLREGWGPDENAN